MSLTARDSLWEAIVPGGAAEQIVRRIGEAIGAGLLRAGEKLPSEVELARRFGVAAMTVRQALAALRSEGYIETRRGRDGGSFVRDDIAAQIALLAKKSIFTAQQLRDLTDWRSTVSGGAAALAAQRATPAQVDELQHAANTVRAATNDPGAYRMADAYFHILTAEITQSSRLIAAETEIQQELTTIIAPLPGADDLVRATSHQAHTDILMAIFRGDPEAAHSRMADHSESTYDWLTGLHLGRFSS